MRNILLPIYEFHELSAKAQAKVIEETIEAWIYNHGLVPFGAIKKVNKAEKEMTALRTPWFLPEMIYETCLEEIILFCKEYEYTADGMIYSSRKTGD